MKRGVAWIVFVSMWLLNLPALGAVPATMSYQGVLTDGAGAVVPDGAHNFTFRLYDALTGGVVAWGPENHTSVMVTRGGFSVLLGSLTPLTLEFDKQFYLEIAVDGGAALSPRVPLASSPYSLRAKMAEVKFARVDVAATTTIGAAWTPYAGAEVVINAPGPGYVVVDASFWLRLNHTNGIKDHALVGISTSPSGQPAFPGMWSGQVSSSMATESNIDLSGHVQYVFPVGPGSQTYWLVGFMNSGQNSGDVFWYGNMSAIYHYDPAPSIATLPARAMKQP